LLANGPYIAPFQDFSLRLLGADRSAIRILPVDLPDRPAPMALVTLKNRTLTPVVERFMEHVRDYIRPDAGWPPRLPAGPKSQQRARRR